MAGATLRPILLTSPSLPTHLLKDMATPLLTVSHILLLLPTPPRHNFCPHRSLQVIPATLSHLLLLLLLPTRQLCSHLSSLPSRLKLRPRPASPRSLWARAITALQPCPTILLHPIITACLAIFLSQWVAHMQPPPPLPLRRRRVCLASK